MKSLATLVALASVIGSAAYAESPLERGSYLVNTIMTCGNCHSPKGPPNVVAGKDFSGGLRFDTPWFDVTAPNITPDKATGIGTWSAANIKTLLLEGVARNGVSIATVMPTGFYGILLPSDLDAIVVYLQSLKPISNRVPDPVYKKPLKRGIFPGTEKPIKSSDLENKIVHGFYLATIGHCMECHTPQIDGVGDFANSLGAGGQKFPGPWSVSVSRNITSSKSKGIGAWTDAEIRRAITQGIDKDGNKLNPPMGYSYYAHMTDSDLDDVIAWLRTVPPKE
jgi:mono/diheme cytochrome c family protein